MDPPHVFVFEEDAVSHVVGIALLLAVTVALVTAVGVVFVGFGQQQGERASAAIGVGGQGSEQGEGQASAGAPRMVIETRADPGADGTLTNPGDGGLCAGDTYADDDKLEIEFVSGSVLNEENVRIVVGSAEASMASCAGGEGELDYLTSVPDEISAGTTITIAEAGGNNAIKSGETVRVVWDAPGSDQSFTLSRSTI